MVKNIVSLIRATVSHKFRGSKNNHDILTSYKRYSMNLLRFVAAKLIVQEALA